METLFENFLENKRYLGVFFFISIRINILTFVEMQKDSVKQIQVNLRAYFLLWLTNILIILSRIVSFVKFRCNCYL